MNRADRVTPRGQSRPDAVPILDALETDELAADPARLIHEDATGDRDALAFVVRSDTFVTVGVLARHG